MRIDSTQDIEKNMPLGLNGNLKDIPQNVLSKQLQSSLIISQQTAAALHTVVIDTRTVKPVGVSRGQRSGRGFLSSSPPLVSLRTPQKA